MARPCRGPHGGAISAQRVGHPVDVGTKHYRKPRHTRASRDIPIAVATAGPALCGSRGGQAPNPIIHAHYDPRNSPTRPFDCSLACMPRKKRTCRRAETRARLPNFREQTTTLRKPTSPGIRTMTCVAIPETVKFSFIEAVAKYRASSPKPRTARLRAAYANCCDALTERGLANAATGPILSSGSGGPGDAHWRSG